MPARLPESQAGARPQARLLETMPARLHRAPREDDRPIDPHDDSDCNGKQ
jgi:hypothetical protein